MSFEKDYQKILKFAKQKVFNIDGNKIDAEDLINDAYVKLHDKQYSIELYFKEIKNASLIEQHNGPNNIPYGIKGVTGGKFTGDYVCFTCKEVKHASEFYILTRSGGKKSLSSYCTTCSKLKALDRYNKKKGTVDYKKSNKENFKKYLDKNRKKWNAYLRERYRIKKIKLPL